MADMATSHARSGRHKSVTEPMHYPWPLMVIAAPAAVAIWSGWVGLGGMCGFGPVNLLPGIGGGFHVNTAITLPVGVEAYGAYALGAWLSPTTPDRARTFARWSALGALGLGMLGQVVYHLLAAAGAARAPWPVVVLVSCLPVATLGFAAALTHLILADLKAPAEAAAEDVASAADDAVAEAVDSAIPEAVEEAAEEAAPVPPEEAIAKPPPVPLEEPAAVPVPEPRKRSARPSKDPDAEKARKAYRESVRGGQPLSDRALGEKYGRSRTWGASRIKEVEGGPLLASAGGE